MKIKRPRKADLNQNLHKYILMKNFRKGVADKFGVSEREHLVIRRTTQLRPKARKIPCSSDEDSNAG